MAYKITRELWVSEFKDHRGLTEQTKRQLEELLATKETKKKCEYLKKREDIYLRSYCEAGCDCPNCHRGDGADKVKDCVYCQLKWKNKGQYNAKKYPQFVKDRKPFFPSPQPQLKEIERVNVHIKGGLFTGKQVYKVDELVETINACVDHLNIINKKIK